MKRFLSLFAGAALVLFVAPAFLFVPRAAQALTVSPVRIELSGDPGQTLQSSFKLINDERQSKNLFTLSENFDSKDETGEPSFIPTKDRLASWISVQQSIVLGPNEQKTIPFSIHIPADAEPGGYFAAIFASTTPPQENGNGTISVGGNLGTLVLLRVNGNIEEGADILEFGTQNRTRFFTSLPVDFYLRFQNSGADRVKPLGDILVKNIFGATTKIVPANPGGGNVLPKSIRRFQASWINGGGGTQDPAAEKVSIPAGFWNHVKAEWRNFAFGFYTAHLNIVYGADQHSATNTFTFMVFPWQLLLVLSVGAIVALIILRFGIKRYNRWIISRARPGRNRNN